MLKTVMELPGDSFEERWSSLEARVGTHCTDMGAPYPETTLELVRPWFASIGNWFDRWYDEIQGPHPIQAPGSDDPALVILREFDDLLSRQAKHLVEGQAPWGERPGLPGEYAYDVGTLASPDGHVLQALESPSAGFGREERIEIPDQVEDLPEGWSYEEGLFHGPDGQKTDLRPSEEYPPRARREAVTALTKYLDLTGSAVHRGRRDRVHEAARERAEREGKTEEEVLDQSVEEAVCVAYGHFLRKNRIVEVDISHLDFGRDSIKTRGDVVGLLSRNLIPGITAPNLRPVINNWVTQDMLGPDWREVEVKPKTEAKAREYARNLRSREHAADDRVLSDLVVRDVLNHDRLSESEREALQLQYAENLSPKEIAERMNCTSSTVRTYLRRGHQKLRDLPA